MKTVIDFPKPSDEPIDDGNLSPEFLPEVIIDEVYILLNHNVTIRLAQVWH